MEEELSDWAAMTESVGSMKDAARTAVFDEMKAHNREDDVQGDQAACSLRLVDIIAKVAF